ncbi:unnamed protein product [Rangifer tarandus platyrhynchus]|uniref:Uncharacterized protein n=1 Tax=Rangifer tarandus platyrhynchus TaxID=3082113 RepID=A0AC59Z1U5_RANTA
MLLSPPDAQDRSLWGTEVTLSGGFTSVSERPQPAWGKRRQVPQNLLTHHNLPVATEGHTAILSTSLPRPLKSTAS